jgi:hypothetical protein
VIAAEADGGDDLAGRAELAVDHVRRLRSLDWRGDGARGRLGWGLHKR